MSHDPKPGLVNRSNSAERTQQQVAIVHRYFADAVFVSSAVQEVHREAALQDRLVVQLVRKSAARAEVFQWIAARFESGTASAVAELLCGTQPAAGARIRNLRIEVHDVVVRFRERHHDVPAHANIERQLRSRI